jgi:Helitron helicase-like domain at N-terminus
MTVVGLFGLIDQILEQWTRSVAIAMLYTGCLKGVPDLAPTSTTPSFQYVAMKARYAIISHIKVFSLIPLLQILLPTLTAAPQPLHRLLHDQTQDAKTFRDHIRNYNSAFAFTSFGVTAIDHTVNAGQGPWVFKVNGEVFHTHGSLLPNEGQTPIYAQLYFYDSTQATNHRLAHAANQNLDRAILQDMHDMLRTSNHFAVTYQHAIERLRTQPPNDMNQTLTLQVDHRTDLRRYNLPTGNEGVAAIIPNIPEATARDIVVHRRQQGADGQSFQRVSEGSGAYDPLHYVLLFPKGELGWHWDLPRVNARNVRHQRNNNDDEDNLEENVLDGREAGANNTGITRMNYYSYRLHQRIGEAETLIRGGKLFQQWIVDAWATVEQARLNWIRFNQVTIRAEMYSGVQDAIDEGGNLGEIGQAMVLPATFTGSPRSMFQKCQDSMSVICHMGKEDLFITMTANPQWPEIQNALLPGQTASDRPELVARVFHQKLKEMIKDIWVNGIFGRAIARVHTIEFQKRGLPHAHILIWLAPEDKPNTEAAVDKIVCAEIPDPAQFPHLHRVVTTSMLHGPCGAEDPNAVCMKDGRCTKRFPKPFQEATSLTEDGYPTYRRRQTNFTFTKRFGRPQREFVYTNQWVVPYNPYLSAKYNCHINVEICNNIHAVKYIHKYIFKGHDRITVGIQQNDEIKKYLDSRYIGPHEAAWRLFAFSMHSVLPTVERLTVHLPDQQMVYFHADDNAEQVQGQMQQDSKLTGYFKYNRENPEDRRLLYADFPKFFVWHRRQRGVAAHWAPRRRGFAIGRMPWVSPRAGERYFLRYLLTAVAGVCFYYYIL